MQQQEKESSVLYDEIPQIKIFKLIKANEKFRPATADGTRIYSSNVGDENRMGILFVTKTVEVPIKKFFGVIDTGKTKTVEHRDFIGYLDFEKEKDGKSTFILYGEQYKKDIEEFCQKAREKLAVEVIIILNSINPKKEYSAPEYDPAHDIGYP